MKKNILTVVIMAATLINLILSIVLVFTIMPAMNKTSNLVDKVASVIDLEIDSQDSKEAEWTMDDLEPYPIKYDTSAKINLQKDPGDDSAHYGIIDGMVVSFNTKAEDYSKVSEMVKAADVYVQDIVKETIGEYTMTNISQTKIKDEAIKKLQEKYNTKAIVDISLTNFLTA